MTCRVLFSITLGGEIHRFWTRVATSHQRIARRLDIRMEEIGKLSDQLKKEEGPRRERLKLEIGKRALRDFEIKREREALERKLTEIQRERETQAAQEPDLVIGRNHPFEYRLNETTAINV